MPTWQGKPIRAHNPAWHHCEWVQVEKYCVLAQHGPDKPFKSSAELGMLAPHGAPDSPGACNPVYATTGIALTLLMAPIIRMSSPNPEQ